MSHFSVMIVTEEQPTSERLAAILQPWHEYECTGVKDEFVVFVDESEEVRQDWTDGAHGYRAPDGTMYYGDELHFYREFTAEEKAKIAPLGGYGSGHGISWSSRDWDDGKGYRAKAHHTPEGYVEARVPWQPRYVTIEQFAEEYHGYEVQPGSIKGFGRWTNPNARWDWWVVGGRWNGMLSSKTQAGGHDSLQVADLAEFPQTFAVVKDGEWYERGKMGWWGMVADGQDIKEWQERTNTLLTELPPTHWITVVDCHI